MYGSYKGQMALRRFHTMPVHVGFVVDEMGLEQGFSVRSINARHSVTSPMLYNAGN
jgi:hypothetical protein